VDIAVGIWRVSDREIERQERILDGERPGVHEQGLAACPADGQPRERERPQKDGLIERLLVELASRPRRIRELFVQ
jgi:hypothetical protein